MDFGFLPSLPLAFGQPALIGALLLAAYAQALARWILDSDADWLRGRFAANGSLAHTVRKSAARWAGDMARAP